MGCLLMLGLDDIGTLCVVLVNVSKKSKISLIHLHQLSEPCTSKSRASRIASRINIRSR